MSAQDPSAEFKWLMPHFNLRNLAQCFDELDAKKAVGIDGKTKEEYGKNLNENLTKLIERMKTMSYRPQPAREVLIPKADGKLRPLGIACIEDKIVQAMYAKVLEAIYEPLFKDCSYGFRPGRNCHQMVKGVNDYIFSHWCPIILDVDLENFFGTIQHPKLLALLEMKIKDKVFLRYISRMLKSGILTKEGFKMGTEGTAQGSVCSPILANIFAHYALDAWFEDVVKVRCPNARLFRYCDDFVICCSNETDAMRIAEVLPKRLDRFSLRENAEKSKQVKLDKRELQNGKKSQETFDLLGFTFMLGKTRRGMIVPKVRTNAKRARKKLKEIKEWCKTNRSKGRLPDLWQRLQMKLRGYIQYYGISNNGPTLRRFVYEAIRIFFKWMNRRSQKKSFTWEKFALFMEKFPPVKVHIPHRLF